VDREREINDFIPVEYWTIGAELTQKETAADKTTFRAMLVSLANGTKLDIRNEEEAATIGGELEEASYSVSKTKTKKVSRQPAPPFITSTLQQEAWRRLRFSASQTMVVAQQLYEGISLGSEGSVGLITYMRTDSTRVARTALVEAREFITSKYGAEFIPPHARAFTTAIKGAQEAHEAIRPTRIRREPSSIKSYLNRNQLRLYELIWKRMVASQMSAALFNNTTVDIEAKCIHTRTDYLLRTSSFVNTFPGFTILYTEQKDQTEEEEKSPRLPRLEKGDELKLVELFPEQHFTQPPPRFTEATLIKTLEQWGIGRPSTYAPILSTIQEREYVTKTKGVFQPTELGNVVNDLVSQYFPDIVDIQFTARMEDELDEIANEKGNWVEVVQDFYTPFDKSLSKASTQMEKVKLADEPTGEDCPNCGKPIVIKAGRFGKFLACSGYPSCKFTRSFQIKTGVNCPECGGDLVEKVSKKKRTFYGCGNYPNCQFATNSRPLPQPCPECGSLLTEYRGKQSKCTKCSYKGKLQNE